MRDKRYTFLFTLSITVALSFLFPHGGQWMSNTIPSLQTVLIMLMYFGLGLGTEFSMLLGGLSQWKLLVYVQGSLFLIAPIVSYGMFKLLSLWIGIENSMGLLFVGCLPTTITSCILLTKQSDGNSIGAMYNATLSQILGVFTTPLLLSLFLHAEVQGTAPLGSVMLSLAQKILLPLLAGQLVRYSLKKVVQMVGKLPDLVTFYAIFIILYMNLSQVLGAKHASADFVSMVFSAIAAVVLFVLLLLLVWTISGLLGFKREDRIASTYTGTQKTLGMGVPLAAIFFADNPELISKATIIIIVYYISSLFFSFLLVEKLVKKRYAIAEYL